MIITGIESNFINLIIFIILIRKLIFAEKKKLLFFNGLPLCPFGIGLAQSLHHLLTMMTTQGEGKPRIIILDDDLELCSLVGGILEDHDFDVVTFADPLEALDSMLEIRPDLIIADINMPKMDGLTFREQLFNDDRFRLIPIIFLTARRHAEQRIEGLMAGADAYVTKPFLPRELIATVKNVLRRARHYQAPSQSSPHSDELPTQKR